MLNNKFYIYRHIRPDKNEIFYIGKGNNLDKRKSMYRRANEHVKRSIFWKKIFNLNNKDIIVEILFECDNDIIANIKEKEFISLYGRKDLHTGTLVNMTNGGDGTVGVIYSDERKAKIKEWVKNNNPRLGKKHSDATKKILSNKAKIRKTPNPFKGKRHTKETIELLKLKALGRKSGRSKKVINVLSGEVFETAKVAAKAFNMNYTNFVYRHLSECYKNNKTPFIYLSDYDILGKEESLKKTCIPKRHSKAMYKSVIDTISGKSYECIKEAADDIGVDVSTLRRRLQGIFVNNTNLKYADGM